MAIKQLSIFVGNNNGSLAEITGAFADVGINLRAMSVADTQDYGILRIIVSDSERAALLMREKGYIFSVTEVVAASIPNQPGGLAKVLNLLSDNEISVEYIYAFVATAKDNAYVVLRVNDNEKTDKLLSENAINTITDADIANL